jgi:hypothetical protein
MFKDLSRDDCIIFSLGMGSEGSILVSREVTEPSAVA